MIRVVLTGGPGSGKTVISAALTQADPQRLVAIPEAATQVYRDAQTRWDRVDDAGRRELQRRIYFLQRAQEESLAQKHPGKIHLLDRGTIDGATYWPDGAAAYWPAVGSTLATELARYDHVLWLQTAASIGVYDGSDSNPVRFEDAQGAIRSGEALAALWSAHPSFHRIPASAVLEEKIARIRHLIAALTFPAKETP